MYTLEVNKPLLNKVCVAVFNFTVKSLAILNIDQSEAI